MGGPVYLRRGLLKERGTVKSKSHWSRFLRFVEKDGLIAVFNQINPLPIYLRKETWDVVRKPAEDRIISDGENSIIEILKKERLLITNESEDSFCLSEVRKRIIQEIDRTGILYLMLAQGCNFACPTCPIPKLAKIYGASLMSFKTAVTGIEMWREHIGEQENRNDFYIIFYGGEPLLNRKIFEEILPVISEMKDRGLLPENLKLMLCTNGALVDESLANLLLKYGVIAAIGIDGPQDHNDRLRIDETGKPTFLRIERAIKLLVKIGVEVVASVTITPQNLKELESYPDFLKEKGISKFGFNLIKGKALDSMLNGMSRKEYFLAAAKAISANFSGTNGKSFEYQLEKKLDILTNGTIFGVDCTCYGSQLVIQADGQVTNCPFLRIDQGNVMDLPKDFRIWKTDAVREWRKRLPIFQSEKILKQRLFLDGGGCAWSSEEISGSIESKDLDNEIFNEEVLNELIWRIIPDQEKESLVSGRTDYWIHRRIGTV